MPFDAVLQRAREGDNAAFEALLRRHERLVSGTVWQSLGGHAAMVSDVEDAAQEVFLRLHQNLTRLDPNRPLAAWLYRVTVNVCRTLGRKRRLRPTVLELTRLGVNFHNTGQSRVVDVQGRLLG